MCDKGKRQSPIDIRTHDLLYDPNLGELIIESNLVRIQFRVMIMMRILRENINIVNSAQ